MKLYQIANEVQNILDNIDEDGELTQDMTDSLNLLQQDFENKAISVACYIKNIEAEKIMVEDAIKNMVVRKNILELRAKSLTDNLQSYLQRMEINEIKSSPYFKIKLKKCPPSVEVFDENLIPSEFWREKVVSSIDKMKIKEVMRDGVEVPGATIQSKIKLEIK